MSLVEGREVIEVNEADFIDASAAINCWQQFPASAILHHGKPCCAAAREWLFSMDHTQLGGESPLTGPRWLRQRYNWGPSRWPLHWCEAVEKKTLDCGAHAALAREVFAARSLTSYPAQFIQQYTEEATRHWARKWKGDECQAHWIREDLIYHEGCAVVAGDAGEVKLWDPSAGWWVNPKQFGGYGGLVALRVLVPEFANGAQLRWGAHRIAPNVWQKIERARGDFA